MGMFDSVYALIKCPRCGDVREREVQFKLSVGRAYSPRCQDVRVGEKLSGFPPLKLAESCGFVTFDECCEPGPDWDSLDSGNVLVVIEWGAVTRVVYPLPEEHEWAQLPTGKNTRRRAAASTERFERAFREHQAKIARERREPGIGGDILAGLLGEIRWSQFRRRINEGRLLDAVRILWNIVKDTWRGPASSRGLERLSFAMAYPLRQPLDYASISRRLFAVKAMPGMPGEVHRSGHYVRGRDSRWQRLKESVY